MSPFLTGLSSRPPLPSITRLAIYSRRVIKMAAGLTVAKLGAIFPNVTTLEYLYPDRNAIEMQLLANPFPRLTALRIRDLEFKVPDADIVPLTNTFQPVWSITKFEFNVTGNAPHFGMSLLRTFAPTLEHVYINKMHIELICDYKFVLIPVMPRLRGFRITLYKASECMGCNYVLPQLQFETENAAKKIVYGKQFPLLERIRVGFLSTHEDRETYFETVAKFLYGSFLSSDVCETLHHIDVPLPSGDRFRLRGERGLSCAYGGDDCTCWDWEGSVKFLDRVATTFPNMRYNSSFDEMRRNMRRAEVQKWIENGIELGVLDRQEEGYGGRDERLVNIEIGGVKVRLVESEEAGVI
ncbi:uncharacterized protein LOC118435683 [Folsomia candida]|uniref:uncharacterized protein LOC118435683 n=1 Tax=Folsomia candida TaxID=158441 RepID=UPI00160527E7|nr:uncharacterized protein LOC118435683 [Folsomia candida]